MNATQISTYLNIVLAAIALCTIIYSAVRRILKNERALQGMKLVLSSILELSASFAVGISINMSAKYLSWIYACLIYAVVFELFQYLREAIPNSRSAILGLLAYLLLLAMIPANKQFTTLNIQHANDEHRIASLEKLVIPIVSSPDGLKNAQQAFAQMLVSNSIARIARVTNSTAAAP